MGRLPELSVEDGISSPQVRDVLAGEIDKLAFLQLRGHNDSLAPQCDISKPIILNDERE